MAIYRCNKCGYLAEHEQDRVGVRSPCPRCGTDTVTHATLYFVEQLLNRYFSLARELQAMRAEESEQAQSSGTEAPEVPEPLASVVLHDTVALATTAQHEPLNTWFEERRISANFDLSAVDTSGFFDEAAVLIGRAEPVVSELMDRIRSAQKKGFTFVNLDLSKKSQNEIVTATDFSRRMYGYSFFARSIYQKQEKVLRLTFQQAQNIKKFFDGAWLEWFALMETLEVAQKLNKRVSCARNVLITFSNGDKHELDVVLLIDGKALLVIEAKTGEFRQSIEKCATLKRRLGIDPNHFLICAADLTAELAVGLSSMHQMTFVSPKDLRATLQRVIAV